jgi:COP9 signalosome complex subunit 3
LPSTQAHLLFSENFRELSSVLTKFNDVLKKNVQHLDNVLETLDLQQHSIGILAVLCAKFSDFNFVSVTMEVFKPLFNQVQEFIIGCNGEQVRLVPDMCKYNNNALSSKETITIAIILALL